MENITEEELKYLCRQFSNMFGLTTRIYYKYEQIYYHSIINIDADPIDLCKKEIFKEQAEVSYYLYDDFLYFGIINYKCYKIVIGPVSELKYSENDAQRLGFLLGVKNESLCHFASEMKAL